MNQIDTKYLRQAIRKGPNDPLAIRPFAWGMYGFVMVMLSYYSRVRTVLKIDYDSFMIIQTVVSHSLYQFNKTKAGSKSYYELEVEWEKLINKDISNSEEIIRDTLPDASNKSKLKLTISSICLVISLPKETVRRKVNELVKKKLLNLSKKNGITLGSAYKKVFREFTPQTTQDVSKLVRRWNKEGIIKSLLSFKI